MYFSPTQRYWAVRGSSCAAPRIRAASTNRDFPGAGEVAAALGNGWKPIEPFF